MLQKGADTTEFGIFDQVDKGTLRTIDVTRDVVDRVARPGGEPVDVVEEDAVFEQDVCQSAGVARTHAATLEDKGGVEHVACQVRLHGAIVALQLASETKLAGAPLSYHGRMDERITELAGYRVRVVRRKGMRNIRLRVEGDGSLVVSAPPSATIGEMRDAVERNGAWIERQRNRLAKSPMAQAAYASDEDKRVWRVTVEGAVAPLLEIWEPIIGVRVKKLAFRNMKSCWGSCQPATGRVCINTRLVLYPPRCLEYVVVHELVHMLEPSHNARFHELMDGFLPDWRERRKLLR